MCQNKIQITEKTEIVKYTVWTQFNDISPKLKPFGNFCVNIGEESSKLCLSSKPDIECQVWEQWLWSTFQ